MQRIEVTKVYTKHQRKTKKKGNKKGKWINGLQIQNSYQIPNWIIDT